MTIRGIFCDLLGTNYPGEYAGNGIRVFFGDGRVVEDDQTFRQAGGRALLTGADLPPP